MVFKQKNNVNKKKIHKPKSLNIKYNLYDNYSFVNIVNAKLSSL